MTISQDQWKWFGNAGHFIGGNQCRFHLCTQIGVYLISTVGEYWPDAQTRMIHAEYEDPSWYAKNRDKRGDEFDNLYMERFAYEAIGMNRTYETMVFKAGSPCRAKGCACGLPEIGSSELDCEGYNNAGAATRGHLTMCKKYASKQSPREKK